MPRPVGILTALASLTSSNLAPNLLVGAGVEIGEGVELGANVVIHDQVELGEEARIETGSVLGRITAPNRRSRSRPSGPGATVIEAHASVGAHSLVNAGATLGRHSLLGDLAIVRDGVRLGADAMVGSQCGIARDVVIGDRARMQNQCLVGPGVVIEEDCFLGPGVQLLTGRTMSGPDRRSPPVLRRGCQIGAGATIMSGIEIGEEAVVGAGAVVTADVEPGATVRGVPARVAAAAPGG